MSHTILWKVMPNKQKKSEQKNNEKSMKREQNARVKKWQQFTLLRYGYELATEYMFLFNPWLSRMHPTAVFRYVCFSLSIPNPFALLSRNIFNI